MGDILIWMGPRLGDVNEIEVSRRVEQPPVVVFPVLRDFEGYPAYSTYLKGVNQVSENGQQPTYALQFAWWRLSYETRTRVLDLDPPHVIEWEVTSELDASGQWTVAEPAEGQSRLTLRIEYDASSLTGGGVSLPFGVSLEWVREKVEPMIRREADRVLERIATELETDGPS